MGSRAVKIGTEDTNKVMSLVMEVLVFGYVLHVQDLCELRKRSIPLFDLVSLAFLYYFLFWEERDIKFEQKYLFTHDFNRGGLRKTNGTYLK